MVVIHDSHGFARLSSRPLLMVDRVVSRRVNESRLYGKPNTKETDLGGCPYIYALPLKPRAVIVRRALSDVEGGGSLADGQT